MTKPIISVLALKLIEKGKLRLYDPVSAFIPSFNNLKVLNPDGTTENIIRPMNIEDLLTHRSGLTYDFLYNVAKDLNDKNSFMMVGGGKGNDPLVFNDGGKPFRGFLEGRVKDKSYCLILHLSNQEFKGV